MIVTTGTASGKSLAFNLPCSTRWPRPRARALYLYPAKALSQDQARALAAFRLPQAAAGDLRRRHAARAAPGDPPASNLVLTNPDMLHVGILPNHQAWGPS